MGVSACADQMAVKAGQRAGMMWCSKTCLLLDALATAVAMASAVAVATALEAAEASALPKEP